MPASNSFATEKQVFCTGVWTGRGDVMDFGNLICHYDKWLTSGSSTYDTYDVRSHNHRGGTF